MRARGCLWVAGCNLRFCRGSCRLGASPTEGGTMLRLLAYALILAYCLSFWLLVGAVAAHAGPDPAPGAGKARIDWTYSYMTHLRDGRRVRCTVFWRTGRRVCVVVP